MLMVPLVFAATPGPWAATPTIRFPRTWELADEVKSGCGDNADGQDNIEQLHDDSFQI